MAKYARINAELHHELHCKNKEISILKDKLAGTADNRDPSATTGVSIQTNQQRNQ